MSDLAIRIEGLGKQYRIGVRQERYRTFRDTVTTAFTSPFRKAANLVRGVHTGAAGLTETIWALKDVSFEVKQGEVVGIIGRNGAGKTTLLKILSRITEPTEGHADIYGRVGSLLEVGTGFHPELTGRENIYLNGAILGMRKIEIDRKFDEIVSFAEIEKFIDTPVKHYSSGMYVRLAFAVAAHLEPEILLVDEVLAVGDTSFQNKCLGKMGDVAKEGRTILFVSHQLNQIRRLCNKCIWFDVGQIRMYCSTVEAVSAYEVAASQVPKNDKTGREDISRSGASFLRWEIVEQSMSKPNYLSGMGTLVLKFVVRVNQSIMDGHHGVALWNKDGQLIWGWAKDNVRLETGVNKLVYTLPGLPLRPGPYRWQVSLYENGRLLDNWLCVPDMIISTEPQSHPRDEWTGVLNLPCDFKIEHIDGV